MWCDKRDFCLEIFFTPVIWAEISPASHLYGGHQVQDKMALPYRAPTAGTVPCHKENTTAAAGHFFRDSEK